jgi:hypothetical protein
VIVLGSAILLEFLQILLPDRDARIVDAIEKIAGGGTGVFAAQWLFRSPWGGVGLGPLHNLEKAAIIASLQPDPNRAANGIRAVDATILTNE